MQPTLGTSSGSIKKKRERERESSEISLKFVINHKPAGRKTRPSEFYILKPNICGSSV